MPEWGLRRPYPVPGRCWAKIILNKQRSGPVEVPLRAVLIWFVFLGIKWGNLWDLLGSHPGGLGSSSSYTLMKNFNVWRDFVPCNWLRSSVGARPGTGCVWWVCVFLHLSQRTELPSPCWTSWSAVTWWTPRIRWRCCRGTPHHPSTLSSLLRSCACKCLLGWARAFSAWSCSILGSDVLNRLPYKWIFQFVMGSLILKLREREQFCYNCQSRWEFGAHQVAGISPHVLKISLVA